VGITFGNIFRASGSSAKSCMAQFSVLRFTGFANGCSLSGHSVRHAADVDQDHGVARHLAGGLRFGPHTVQVSWQGKADLRESGVARPAAAPTEGRRPWGTQV